MRFLPAALLVVSGLLLTHLSFHLGSPKQVASGWCPGPTHSSLLLFAGHPAPPLLDLLLEGDLRSLHPVVGREGSEVTAPPASSPLAGGGVAEVLSTKRLIAMSLMFGMPF